MGSFLFPREARSRMRSEEREREIERKRRRWEKKREENMIYHNLFEWLAHWALGML